MVAGKGRELPSRLEALEKIATAMIAKRKIFG